MRKNIDIDDMLMAKAQKAAFAIAMFTFVAAVATAVQAWTAYRDRACARRSRAGSREIISAATSEAFAVPDVVGF